MDSIFATIISWLVTINTIVATVLAWHDMIWFSIVNIALWVFVVAYIALKPQK